MPTQDNPVHITQRACARPLIRILAMLLALSVSGIGIASAHRHAHSRMIRRGGWSRTSRALPSRSTTFRRGVVATHVPTNTTPMTEVRALWVVRDSIASPARVTNVIATAKKYGFNTLFVQVRGRGDAFYTSTLEPRAEELANQDPSFDPLAMVIALAHANHIEVHAWLNTCYVWGAGRKPSDPTHVVNAHPDWLACDADGRYFLGPQDGCEGAFLSPGNPNARQHIHDVFLDVATRYDIDGIHFDYVRYANQNYDYSQGALDNFAKTMNESLPGYEQKSLAAQGRLAYVHAFPDQYADWRRRQVTDLVASISQDVKKVKPWVVVSAAVFADASDAYKTRGQDWKAWLKDGLIDVVCPMAYGSSTPLVAQQMRDAAQTAQMSGRACYAGIGSWHISAASTDEKIAAARAAGATGIILFSYGGVTRDGTSDAYLNSLATTGFARPATMPNLAWIPARTDAPSTTGTSKASQAAELSDLTLVVLDLIFYWVGYDTSMTKSMLAAKGKAKIASSKGGPHIGSNNLPDAISRIGQEKAVSPNVQHGTNEQRGTFAQRRLIGDLPAGRLAGKYKDDPVFAAIMDEIHAATDAELSALGDSE